MSGYGALARYYDLLTYNVDYKRQAQYFFDLLLKFAPKPSLVLDLACGTGSLTLRLAQMGIEMIGVDASADMLSLARQKAEDKNLDILFLQQKMQQLDLYGTVDAVICSLDSINHLIFREDVQKTFDRVSLFLNNGGLFVFDVNTIYKHKKVLSGKTFVYDLPQLYCVWQNDKVTDDNIINMSLDFFVKQGDKYFRETDFVSEKAYSMQDFEDMLDKSGLNLVDVYGDLTFERPAPNSLRNVIVAKKA